MSELTEKSCCSSPQGRSNCTTIDTMPQNPTLAFAYIKFQYPKETYGPVKALSRGTVFPCLDRPYKYSPSEGRVCCEKE